MKRRHLILLSVLCLTAVRVHAQDKFVTLDDVTLRYQIAGDGPAVVLIHGWAVSLESWHFLFPVLSEHYTVVRYDRRGFGKSGGSSDLSLDPVDLRELLDGLGLDKVVVVGHSQGTDTALRFALAFPERMSGLVLVGAGPPDGFGLPFNGPDAIQFELLAKTAREEGMDAMRAIFNGHPLMNGFIEGTEGFKIAMTMFGAYDGKDLLEPIPPVNATPVPRVDRLSEIAVPTLVITGELEMPYFQIVADALAYAIPNAKRVEVPGGGHSVMLQNPDRFNNEIVRFLATLKR